MSSSPVCLGNDPLLDYVAAKAANRGHHTPSIRLLLTLAKCLHVRWMERHMRCYLNPT